MKSALDYYQEELAALPSRVGERNRRLLVVGYKAARAGVAEVQAIGEIIAAGGEPRLTRGEVSRAVRKAYQQTLAIGGGAFRPARPTSRRHGALAGRAGLKPPPPVKSTSTAFSFVREMIARGRMVAASQVDAASAASPTPPRLSDLIRSLSPVPIPETPRQQAYEFIFSFPIDVKELYFVGDPLKPRTRDTIMDFGELGTRLLENPAFVIPTHFMPNDVTGEGVPNEKGDLSYAKEACIKHHRYALIEFDQLPREEQEAFWLGCIDYGKLPIRSLVWSGHKSIHGLLRLSADEDYKAAWDFLEHILSSDPDPRYRCDTACRNPGRLTRFPGALRPETGDVQSLLFLSSEF